MQIFYYNAQNKSFPILVCCINTIFFSIYYQTNHSHHKSKTERQQFLLPAQRHRKLFLATFSFWKIVPSDAIQITALISFERCNNLYKPSSLFYIFGSRSLNFSLNSNPNSPLRSFSFSETILWSGKLSEMMRFKQRYDP